MRASLVGLTRISAITPLTGAKNKPVSIVQVILTCRFLSLLSDPAPDPAPVVPLKRKALSLPEKEDASARRLPKHGASNPTIRSALAQDVIVTPSTSRNGITREVTAAAGMKSASKKPRTEDPKQVAKRAMGSERQRAADGGHPGPNSEVIVIDEAGDEAGAPGAVRPGDLPPPDATGLDALKTTVARMQKEMETDKHRMNELQKLVGLLQGQLGILTTELALVRSAVRA